MMSSQSLINIPLHDEISECVFCFLCCHLHNATSYRTHIILYTVFNVACGAECLMYMVYYLLFQFSSLTGYNRKNLHLLSSSAPFSVRAQLPYKACFNVKLSTLSLSPHSAFLMSLSLYFSLPPFVAIFSFIFVFFSFHILFSLVFSSLSHPSLSFSLCLHLLSLVLCCQTWQWIVSHWPRQNLAWEGISS